MKDHSLRLTFHDGAIGSKTKSGKKNKKDKTSLKVCDGKSIRRRKVSSARRLDISRKDCPKK